MGVKAIRYVYSIECNKSGEGYDTMGEAFSLKMQVRQLINHGWKGTYKNIICPDCIKKTAALLAESEVGG